METVLNQARAPAICTHICQHLSLGWNSNDPHLLLSPMVKRQWDPPFARSEVLRMTRGPVCRMVPKDDDADIAALHSTEGGPLLICSLQLKVLYNLQGLALLSLDT